MEQIIRVRLKDLSQGARIAYVTWDWNLYVSWSGTMNGVFWADPTAVVTPTWWSWDFSRWMKTLPSWVTDVKTLWSSLLFLWPKQIYATASEHTLALWNFVSWTDNEDWYYSPWSYHNDDWEFLLARRWKVLWTLQLQVSYSNSISFNSPESGKTSQYSIIVSFFLVILLIICLL